MFEGLLLKYDNLLAKQFDKRISKIQRVFIVIVRIVSESTGSLDHKLPRQRVHDYD